MSHLDRYKQQLSGMMFVAIFLPAAFTLFTYIFLSELLDQPFYISCSGAVAVLIILLLLTYQVAIKSSQEPVEKIWQAMLHVNPNKNSAAPKMSNLKIGRELVSSLVMQIYDLASNTHKAGEEAIETVNSGGLADVLPLPLIVLNKEKVITVANKAAATYLNLPLNKIVGKYVYDVLHMSFSSDDTLEKWLENVSEKRATDTKSWEHVRISLDDPKTVRQFDMSASFSKDNTSGNEVVIMLFDKTDTYNKIDGSTSYVAMAVHELRTPLTVLRGYIEVFEDELGDKLSPELREFMRKMNASAQTLTAFVSNILNVARIDETQMTLSLREADWGKVIEEIIKDLELRASVRGKQIKLDVEPNLPTVAIDKISMYEVVSNLVDNAIKYSGQSTDILVKVYKSKEGTVDTTVEDKGVGIPESAIKDLFTKYYRSHRSKNVVSGSGLGLYLVKSIIDAHGGTVWVHSKAGEGSTFGFSLQTYAAASEGNKLDQDGIERHASGWIKNHSLYRR